MNKSVTTKIVAIVLMLSSYCSSALEVIDYAYDDLERLKSANYLINGSFFEYDYDEIHNRTSEIRNVISNTPRTQIDNFRVGENQDLTVGKPGVLINDSNPFGESMTAVLVAEASNGKVNLLENGSFTYRPNKNYYGIDRFTYVALNSAGRSQITDVNINVIPIFNPPRALFDRYEINEDTESIFSVLLNDQTLPNEDLLISNVNALSSEGASLEIVNNNIKYTPFNNFYGIDFFDYTITDTSGRTSTTTVEVTVISSGDSPVAENDSGEIVEDSSITLDVLANDSDADGDQISVSSYDTKSSLGGTVNLVDGKLVYDPAPNFFGKDSFNYTIKDPSNRTDSATVTITVTAVNDKPVAENDDARTLEDSPVTIDVLANDTDVESASLSIESFDNNSTQGGAVTLVDGKLVYNPATNFFGSDSFTYTVNDGSPINGISDAATVTITVTAVNDKPVSENDDAQTLEDSPVTIDVLDNDTDDESASLSIDSFDNNSTQGGTVTLVDGKLVYNPATNFFGSDSFTYTVNDSSPINGISDAATVTITVTAVNDKPVAENDDARTLEDSPVTIDVLANDTDVESASLSIESFDNNSTQGGALTLVDGKLVYNPATNFFGSDSFTYTVNDSSPINGISDAATVTITVTAVNDKPVADNDDAQTLEDTPVTIDVLANDTDFESASLSIESFDNNSTQGGAVTLVDGKLVYNPAANFFGTDSFTYTVNDGSPFDGISEPATVTITVTAVNDKPVAENDDAEIFEDTPVTIDVLANDTDVESATLSIESFDNNSANAGAVTLVDGKLVYNPAANFFGTDSFTYTVNDSSPIDGISDPATVTITVRSVNDKPVAENDDAQTLEDTPVTIDVLANDTDVESTDLSIESFDNNSAQGGTVTLVDGKLRYSPADSFFGEDNFSYTIRDLSGDTATGSVSISVSKNITETPSEQHTYINVDPIFDGAYYNLPPLYIPGYNGAVEPGQHVISLTDNNIITSGETALRLNEGESGYFPPEDSKQGTIINGLGPFSVTNAYNKQLPVPYKFMGQIFANYQGGGKAIYYLYSPHNDAQATISISNFQGDSIGSYPITLPKGKIVAWNSSEQVASQETQASASISASTPISVGFASTVNPDVPINPIPPATNELWGYTQFSGMGVTAVEDNTQVTVTISNGDKITQTLNQGMSLQAFPNLVGGVHVSANKPVAANGYYNGLPIPFYPKEHLDNKFGFPLGANTVYIVCTEPDTTILLVDEITKQQFLRSCTTNQDAPDTITWNYTSLNSGYLYPKATLKSSKPIYVIYNAGNATRNLIGSKNGLNGDETYPQKGKDNYTVPINATTELDVLANDNAPNGDKLTITSVINVSNGSASIENNKVLFTPIKNYIGPASFVYHLSNGGYQTSIEVSVDVVAQTKPKAPVAIDDYHVVVTGNTLKVPPYVILLNDYDDNQDQLTAELVTTTTQGALQFDSKGAFEYTPNPNYIGEDTFTYRLSDGTLYSQPATVTIHVGDESSEQHTYINVDPIFDGAYYNLPPLYIPGYNGAVEPGQHVISLTDNNIITSGETALRLNEGESGYFPPEDSKQGTIINGLGPFSVTNAYNKQLPVPYKFMGQIFANYQGGGKAIYYLYSPHNDAQATISISNFQGDSIGSYPITLPKGKIVAWNSSEQVASQETQASASISASTPISVGFASTVNPDVPINPIPPATNELWGYTQFSGMGVTAVEDNTQVTVTISNGDKITQTLNQGMSLQAFPNLVGGVHVSANKPVAANGYYNGLPIPFYPKEHLDNKFGFPLGANTVYIVCTEPDTTILLVDEITKQQFLRSCTTNQDAPDTITWNYTSLNSGYLYPKATLKSSKPIYVIYNAGNATRNLIGSKNGLNGDETYPQKGKDNYTVPINATTELDVLANDNAPNGDKLTITSVINVSNGSASIENNKVLFTPIKNYIGPASFVYHLSNGGYQTSIEVSVDVVAQTKPKAPVAIDDYHVVVTGNTLKVPPYVILLNDYDDNQDQLTAELVTTTTQGALQFDSKGAFEYTPNPNYIGEDTFTYRLSDGTLYSQPATVTIHVGDESSEQHTYINVDPIFDGAYYNLPPLYIPGYNGAVEPGQHVISLTDNNIITSGETALRLNEGESGYFPPEDSKQGTIINGLGPFSVTNAYNKQLPVPYKFMGQIFANYQGGGKAIYYLYSPHNDAQATISISNFQGDSISSYPITLPKGKIVAWNSSEQVASQETQASASISASTPISVGFASTVNPDVPINPIPPATNELWGYTQFSGMGVTAVEDNTQVTVTISNGDKITQTLNQGMSLQAFPNLVGGVHVSANKPVAANGYYNGLPIPFYPKEHLDNKFGFPLGANTVYIVCTEPDTTILLVDEITKQQFLRSCTTNQDAPDTITWNYTSLNSGYLYPKATLKSSKPIYVIYNAGNAARNLIGSKNGLNGDETYPQKGKDNYTVPINATTELDVLANDNAPNGDKLTITSVINVSNGSASIENNKVLFTPIKNYIGPASFVYHLSNGGYQTSIEVSVDVVAQTKPKAPVAIDDYHVVVTGNTLKVPPYVILLNDYDDNQDQLTAELVTTTTQGALQFDSKGAFEYTPNPNYIGEDTFTYRLSDGTLYSQPATVTIHVGGNTETSAGSSGLWLNWIPLLLLN